MIVKGDVGAWRYLIIYQSPWALFGCKKKSERKMEKRDTF